MAEFARWEDLELAKSWQSHSSRQKRNKPMAGTLGTLILPPSGPLVGALLSLGETAHVGSHTTHGLGKYRLHALPG